jgi:hypothetical protein
MADTSHGVAPLTQSTNKWLITGNSDLLTKLGFGSDAHASCPAVVASVGGEPRAPASPGAWVAEEGAGKPAASVARPQLLKIRLSLSMRQ